MEYLRRSVRAGPALARPPRSVGAETSIPYGWVDFCNRHAEECTLGKLTPLDIRLDKHVWKTLNEVNAFANSAIEPISNYDHWGVTLDHWDYPVDGKGDCKIYALFKRKLLIDRGFPRQALLMTIVRDLHGDGHTILTVKTDRGDFVLDNLSADDPALERDRLPVLQTPSSRRSERVGQPRRRHRRAPGLAATNCNRSLGGAPTRANPTFARAAPPRRACWR